MSDPANGTSGESLPQLLAGAARARSDAALVAFALGGVAMAAVAGIARVEGWLVFAGAGAAMGAFGLWGACDRELRERASGGRAAFVATLGAARAAAACVGIVGALLAVFALLRVVLGTWIS